MTEEISLYILLNKLKENLEPDKFQNLRTTCYRFFEEMEVKAAKEAVLYPGAADTLHELRSRRLKLGLVTNNSRAGTMLTLDRFNLSPIFDAIVTRDDCDEMKPAAAPILKILTEMAGCSKSRAIIGLPILTT